MQKSSLLFIVLLITAFVYYGCSTKEIVKEKEEKEEVELTEEEEEIAETLIDTLKIGETHFEIPENAKIESVKIDHEKKKADIYFSRELSLIPFRKENVEEIYSIVKKSYKESLEDFDVTIYTLDVPIEKLIPNYYREYGTYDYNRIPPEKARPEAIVKNTSKTFVVTRGLNQKNILLWHSHGWYYDIEEGRWKWQRARLFQTVEDVLPMAFTIPYIIPMLENAGANVFVPRERDTQKHEVVVDNDYYNNISSREYAEITYGKNISWKTGTGPGFVYDAHPLPVNYNPFLHGTHRIIQTDSEVSGEINWVPDIPETGYYSVSISYSSSENNVDDAHYTVYHLGGETQFKVNQKIGGGTWIYLGKFKFEKGIHPETGKVALTNLSSENGIVSADAVRFGGGMGVVEREGETSGRAKYFEGARYWLQYAGMPDTLVYNLSDTKNDYTDDYRSRGEYGNYLYGAPYGPNRDREVKGLGIPIDLSLAFHTDAGITRNDTVIGTLSIYSLEDFNGDREFPDGVSRLANRDLADIMQTQIVDDIRSKYDVVWNRRDLRNADYSEAVRPNFPSVLLELLSHQNFLDMKFALDPAFRFDVSRSIYKAMLKFLSIQYGFDYVVQPLPVNHFSVEFNNKFNLTLKWKPQEDPLEPTAVPDGYILYTRKDSGGFDNGTFVREPHINIENIEPGVIYSFKVTAVNKGGESFPSEILSAGRTGNKQPFLIVNGFDRVSGPASVDVDGFAGFLNQLDAGVPDKDDLNFTGIQYEFDPSAGFIGNDDPGHGASHGDYETDIIAGNTFDYPYIHGRAMMQNGYSFVSASDETVEDNEIDINKYKLVDLILGEEKETHYQKNYEDTKYGTKFAVFTPELRDEISGYLDNGGNLFISGAYVGTDLYTNSFADESSVEFSKDILKFNWSGNHAARTGDVYCASESFMQKDTEFRYNPELNEKIYQVESPDALNPVEDSETLLRYSENNKNAATGYRKDYGVIVFGFPFETILGEGMQAKLMSEIIKYFGL